MYRKKAGSGKLTATGQTRAALRAKYPTCECNVVLLQIGCTIAVHTGPYALGMGVMRRWKKQ